MWNTAPDLVIMHSQVRVCMCLTIPLDYTYGTWNNVTFFNIIFEDHESFGIKNFGYVCTFRILNVFTKQWFSLQHERHFSKIYLQFDPRLNAKPPSHPRFHDLNSSCATLSHSFTLSLRNHTHVCKPFQISRLNDWNLSVSSDPIPQTHKTLSCVDGWIITNPSYPIPTPPLRHPHFLALDEIALCGICFICFDIGSSLSITCAKVGLFAGLGAQHAAISLQAPKHATSSHATSAMDGNRLKHYDGSHLPSRFSFSANRGNTFDLKGSDSIDSKPSRLERRQMFRNDELDPNQRKWKRVHFNQNHKNIKT